MNESEQLQLFEDQPIRTAWDENAEEWYFSIVDVITVLTDSKSPAAYWRKLKQRLKAEGNESVTNCHGLKLKGVDGKRRLTDVATTEQLLRCAQPAVRMGQDPSLHYCPKKVFFDKLMPPVGRHFLAKNRILGLVNV